jgi:hypothetical protein
MTTNSDFDFKIGRGHYRGHGIQALVALAIVHLRRVAYVRGGLSALYSILPWLWQIIRAHLG